MKRLLLLLSFTLFLWSLPISGLSPGKKAEMVRNHTKAVLMKKGLSEEKALKAVKHLSENSESLREEVRALKRLCRMSRQSLEKMFKSGNSAADSRNTEKAWTVRERKRKVLKESMEKRKEFRSPRWNNNPGAGNSH